MRSAGQDDANNLALLGPKAARGQIRPVIQLFDGAHHGLLFLLGDARRSVQDPGNGRDRNVSQLRDIL